jgi:hypothetical protein
MGADVPWSATSTAAEIQGFTASFGFGLRCLWQGGMLAESDLDAGAGSWQGKAEHRATHSALATTRAIAKKINSCRTQRISCTYCNPTVCFLTVASLRLWRGAYGATVAARDPAAASSIKREML